MPKAVAGVLTNTLHCAEEASLSVGMLLKELVYGLLSVEGEAESIPYGRNQEIVGNQASIGNCDMNFYHHIAIVSFRQRSRKWSSDTQHRPVFSPDILLNIAQSLNLDGKLEAQVNIG